MTVSSKTSLVTLGYAPVDDDHVEFMTLVDELNAADNVAFPTLFARLMAHTEQHFTRENVLMVESGFPALGEHKSEHARVMGEFQQFKLRVDKGLIAFGRSFVRDRVMPWFKLHIATMDSALVAHLNNQPASADLKRAAS